jgi:hypothetical protein
MECSYNESWKKPENVLHSDNEICEMRVALLAPRSYSDM